MLKLFLVGIVSAGAQAFVHFERPIQVAGQALENAADVGSGLVSAAADAAAVTAGLGAHLAGRTAAEAGALAAAASGMSAASTLMGDVLGGQLALGADVVSALVPRPFQHLHNLAALGITGLTSGAAGFTAGNTLGYALGHHHGLPTSHYFPFICGPFVSALFGLKPPHMPQEVFFDTVRGVIDRHYIDDHGNFVAASPVEFVDRLRDAWDDEWAVDVPSFGAVARDLTLASVRFPWLGTPLFLRALHEVCEHLRGAPWPPLPLAPYFDKGWTSENWNGPLSHLWDSAWSHLHDGHYDGDWDTEALNYRSRPGIDTAAAQRNSQPVNQQAYNIFDTTVVAGPGSLIGDTTVTASIDNNFASDDNANQNENPAITASAPITIDTIERVEGQAPEIYPFPPGVPLHELPLSVGCVVVPGWGTYHLTASPLGELTVAIPQLGTVSLSTMSTGQAFVTIPGGGTIPVSPFTTLSVVHVLGFGDVPLRIDTRGYLTVSLPGYGPQPVHTTITGALEASVPSLGSLDVRLQAPARGLVHVPGHGTAVLTISTGGTISVSIRDIGSVPVVAHIDGSLTTYLPQLGNVRLQGISILDAPLPIDHVYLPDFGYFPITTSINGSLVVTVHGLGTFPVITTPSGSLQVMVPRHGTFPVVSMVVREDARDTESTGEDEGASRVFENSPSTHHHHHDVAVPYEDTVVAEPIVEPVVPRPITTVIEPVQQFIYPPPVWPSKHGHHHHYGPAPFYPGATPFVRADPTVFAGPTEYLTSPLSTAATSPAGVFRPPPFYPTPFDKHGHHSHGAYPWGNYPWGTYDFGSQVLREPLVTVTEPRLAAEPILEPINVVEPTTIFPRETWGNGVVRGFPGGDWLPGYGGYPGYSGYPGYPGYPGYWPDVDHDHHDHHHSAIFDGHNLNKWIWSLSDAAVYFLQKLDVFRPAHMAPERFLMTVNQTIVQLHEGNDWKHLTPLKFIRHLGHKLGGYHDIPTIHIESIGEQVANSLEGPFPPFPQILDHISEVISQKLSHN